MKRWIALCLVIGLLLSGCGKAHQSGEFEGPVWETSLVADFGLRLFRQTIDPQENTLISPLSVLAALSMTANGADGNTRAQMEQVLGQSVEALNNWYRYGTCYGDANLHVANGIWIKDDPKLTLQERFLQTVKEYYDAGVFQADFDAQTLQQINRFVQKNTDGMIEKILDELPESSVMCLVNALSFQAQWQATYEDFQVSEGIFTTESGETQPVELMESEESYYFENDLTTGFLKPYQNDRFAFAALLPREGVTVAELAQSLDGLSLQRLVGDAERTSVIAALPKFEATFDVEMGQLLAEMGMSDAVDPGKADFSAMGQYEESPLYIGQVIHKTYICVAEKGTKAGAAIAEPIATGADEPVEKFVMLDRPFLYMILDTESNTPIFIGSFMNAQK